MGGQLLTWISVGKAEALDYFAELFSRVGFIVTRLETDSRVCGGRAVDQGGQAGGEDDAARKAI